MGKWFDSNRSGRKNDPNTGHPFRDPQTPTTQEMDPRIKKAMDEGNSTFKQKQQADIDKLEKWVDDVDAESSVFAHIRHQSALGKRVAMFSAPSVLGWSGKEINTYAVRLLNNIKGISVKVSAGGYIEVSW